MSLLDIMQAAPIADVTHNTRDEEVRQIITTNPNMAVPHFLMSSYAYYHLDAAYISDGCYDWICDVLKNNWESIEHTHKYLIDRNALLAGTGFYIAEYPLMVVSAATAALKRLAADQKR